MCQLLLKEMFGYCEDISVAPGLSDFQDHQGTVCHVREHKKKKEEAAEARHAAGLFFVFFFSMQENTMKDINRAAMSHVSCICKDAVNAPHPVSC